MMTNNITFSSYYAQPTITSSSSSQASLAVHGDMQFTKSESYLQSVNNSIAVDDLITMTKLFKRMIMDIANDPELSTKLPYVAEASQEWLLEELKK